MRIYQDCLEMIQETERDLFEMGIKYQSSTVQDLSVENDTGFETLELNGYSYKLTDIRKANDMLKYGNINPEWANVEFEERVTSRLLNPGNAWKYQKELWEKYLRNGEFEYTYNERIRDQIDYVVLELKKFPNTRQAVITIYDQHKDMRNFGGKARVPCSMYYQFFNRNNKLHCIYTMRSCDFLKHFAGDVYLAIKLGEHIGHKIGIEFGTMTHFIGSLHAFKVDLIKRGIF